MNFKTGLPQISNTLVLVQKVVTKLVFGAGNRDHTTHSSFDYHFSDTTSLTTPSNRQQTTSPQVFFRRLCLDRFSLPASSTSWKFDRSRVPFKFIVSSYSELHIILTLADYSKG